MGGTCKSKMAASPGNDGSQTIKKHESPKQGNDLTNYVCLVSCDKDILSNLGEEGRLSFEGDFSHRDQKMCERQGAVGAGRSPVIASRPFG